MKKLIPLFLIMLMPSVLHATWNDKCEHPRFLEKGCGYEGEDGQDGKDGVDGRDGRDGADGVDGRDGVDGLDGKDGADGVVPTKWITETHNWQRSWGRFSAASDAIQIYLPQDQDHRVTFGMSSIHGNTGLGVGYAYRTDRDDNLAFTAGVGTSHGETVGKVSVGFEFGGRKQMKITMPAVIVEPEPSPDIEPIMIQQQAIEEEHNEDIEQVQMAQNEIGARIQVLEDKRAADLRRQAAYLAEQKRQKEADREYAQKTLSALEKYRD